MSDQPTSDIETLKAQHLNQALTFVEEALATGHGPAANAYIEREAQRKFDALLEAHRQWAATDGPTFTLAILNARTAREQQEAVHNGMQAAFLAGGGGDAGDEGGDDAEGGQVSAHLEHDAPLRHLVAHVLHPNTTLADRVRRLRYKRRKPRQAAQPVEEVPS